MQSTLRTPLSSGIPVVLRRSLVLLRSFAVCLLFASALLRPAPALGVGNWEQTAGPSATGVSTLLRTGSFVYAGTASAGVYRSSDNGTTWTAASSGLGPGVVLALAGENSSIYASIQPDDLGNGGVFRSSDNGATWIPSTSGLGNVYILSLLATGGNVYAGDASAGVFKSTDHGATWFPSNSGLATESVRALTVNGTTLFAAGANFTYRSTNNGASWDQIPDLDFFAIWAFASSGTDIYAGAFGFVLISTDSGETWESKELTFPQLQRITSLTVDGANVYLGTAGAPGAGVYKSTNRGASWQPSNAGIEIVSIDALLFNAGRVLAGALKQGVLVSNNGGASWSRSNTGLAPGGDIRRLLTNGNTLLAATGGDGIYRTTNRGATWIKSDTDPGGRLRNEIVFSLVSKGGQLFAGAASTGVYRSPDGGLNWTQANAGLPVTQILALTTVSANLLAGTGSDGIFLSSDSGTTWLPTTVSNGVVQGLAASGPNAYAIVYTGSFQSTGIYRSTNGGLGWSLVFPAGTSNPVSIAADGSFVYVGDLLSGMLRSTNGGTDWQDISPEPGIGVYSIQPTTEALYAGGGTAGQQVYRSTNHGSTWVRFDEGLVDGEAGEALAAEPNWVYLGTDWHGVWRRSLSDPADVAEAAPGSALRQNEPNPFSDRSVIRFSLPGAGATRLSLFDAGGRLVSVLLNGQFEAGEHARVVDGSGMAPGVYFYMLEAPGVLETRKLVVRN